MKRRMERPPLSEITNAPRPAAQVLREWDEQRGTEVWRLDQHVRKIFRRTSQRPGWGIKQWVDEVRMQRKAHGAMRGSRDMYVPEVVKVRYDGANDEPQWLYMDMVRCPNDDAPLNDAHLTSTACAQLRRGLKRLRRKLGVIHGDLKPQNVLWNAKRRRWCLIDFEIVYEASTYPTSLGEGEPHETNYIWHCVNDDDKNTENLQEMTFASAVAGMPPRGYLLGGSAPFLNARGPAA